MKVHLLATGGTIEKVYSEQFGVVQNAEAKIDRYLKLLRLPDLEIRTEHLMNKDSLDLTEADRERICEAVSAALAPNSPVLITHGTDTMVETGRFLETRLRTIEAPVILTGAMAPLGFESSDGLQNLTESLLAARLLPPGVWLVMHNEVFKISRVRKDRELSRFIAHEPEQTLL